ncbi:uncharacterized protein LOC132033568 [Lycium ferocissimum]|uniref:uncharacterized protein LOC132033568 n=1 Tax=Lycium ferocissimum TaxID=112874 RepID=UPI00281649AC|nr:uncharacterized protein LOC132033568 [Lycium ferocissimum]
MAPVTRKAEKPTDGENEGDDEVDKDEETREESEKANEKVVEGDEENDEGDGEEGYEGDERSEEDEETEKGNEEEEESPDHMSTTLAELRKKRKHNVNANILESSSIAINPNRPSIDEVVKSFSIEKYGMRIPLNENNDLSGDIVVKSSMGKGFDKFRGILRQQGLENFFRASCFGLYLDLPQETGARFQMIMASGLLRRRIISDRKDEVWIN